MARLGGEFDVTNEWQLWFTATSTDNKRLVGPRDFSVEYLPTNDDTAPLATDEGIPINPGTAGIVSVQSGDRVWARVTQGRANPDGRFSWIPA